MEKAQLKKNNFIYISIVTLLLSCSSKNTNNIFYKETLGLNVKVENRVYSYNEESAQNEGFTFEIIRFSKREGDLLFQQDDYPKKYKFREDWTVSKWKQTPPVDKIEALDLLFKYSIRNTELQFHINEIKNLIEIKGNYFSYYFKSEGNYIYSIEFYLINVSKSQIYIIEIET